MADTFYAVSRIEGGTLEEDGSQNGKHVPVTFMPGDKVTGLDSVAMKGLWRAGALTRTKPEESESDEAEPDDKGPDAGTGTSDSTPSKPVEATAPKAATTAS
jgi:hypothetical protein